MDDGGSFAEHALDLTVRVSPPCDTVARLRRMFSGQGIFCDGVMFALVADDTLYLKGDDDMKPAFLDAGSSPFTYEKVRGEIELPPRRSRRGCREITRLGHMALDAANRGQSKKSAKTPKNPLTAPQLPFLNRPLPPRGGDHNARRPS
jgi:DNA transformation protein